MPHPQPSPSRNPGGDCFACATFAIVRHLLPGQHCEDFHSIWERYQFEYEPNPDVTPGPNSPTHYTQNDWLGYGRVLTKLGEEYGISHRYELIPPDYEPQRRNAPWFAGYLTSWHNALAAHINAGHVLMGSIRFSATGQRHRGGLHDTDHAILVDGWRTVWRPVGAVPGARRQDIEYHVVCSARGAYWIDQDELVWCHGFGAWIAVSGKGDLNA